MLHGTVGHSFTKLQSTKRLRVFGCLFDNLQYFLLIIMNCRDVTCVMFDVVFH